MPRLIISLLALILCVAMRSAFALPDEVTVGSNAGLPGANVDIPIYIRDVSGSPLGIDQPSGSRIQSYSIKVNYAPAAAVQSVTFARAGITAALTPTFESTPNNPGTISAIDSFEEATNPIPFTLNAAAPGNQIGVLHFVLAANATPGTVTLTLDTILTQLSNASGTVNETTAATNLALVNGSITVNPMVGVRLQSFDIK